MKQKKIIQIVLLALTGSALAEWNGEYYHKHSGPQVHSGALLLEKLIFRGNESVLDIGCGSGRLSSIIASKVPQGQVHAIDISESMIECAQKEYNTSFKNLSFEQCDVLHIDYKNKFDVVTCFACLHFVPDQQKALIKVAQSLKPNGIAYLVFAANNDNLPFMRAWEDISSTKKWSGYKISFKYLDFFTPTKEEAFVMLEQANLTGNIEVIEKKYRFKTIEEYKAWLKGFLVGLSQFASLSPEQQDEFLLEVIEQSSTRTQVKRNGFIEHRVPNLRVYATKK